MINTFEETDDFTRFRRTTNTEENYFLTIFDETGISSYNLGNYKKEILTFGANGNNDIVIQSNLVDDFQGTLSFTEYGILATNQSKTCHMLSNGNKEFDNIYIREGSFLKFINQSYSDTMGVIFILSIGENLDEWKIYSLKYGDNKLGSNGSCDIVLPPAGVAKLHAILKYNRNHPSIRDDYSLNGTYVNGVKIPYKQDYKLNNLDVILIGNTKIIFISGKLIYQISERGIQLDAIDIVKRVKIKFKSKVISSHVNMSIKPGEFVAFVGGSGAGKSTFIKCISGITKPTSGKVLLNGENLYENYDTLKYEIGYVPQDDIVFSNLTLIDMLKYAAKLRMPDNTNWKDRMKRITEVLDIVQLREFKDSYIRQLSGGQRKRASIAVELIADPGLFFLDEPTSGLDPGTERSVMKTLQKMSRMGKTVILVTHNTLNLHLCDKIAFFGSGGRLCFFGSPKEALNFFEVDDFVDIYTLLNDNSSYWHEKYEDMTASTNKKQSIEEKKKNRPTKPNKSFFRQLINLICRYAQLIINDFQQLLLIFAQAPLIGYLLTLVASDNVYKGYDDTKAVLFSIACTCIWFGLLNSVQEICKEKVILQKEHMADLKLSAYLLSKFFVQAFFAFAQSILLVVVFQSIVGKSDTSILIDAFWDMQIICFLTILSASALGLFISSIVKNSNMAMSIIPLLLVPQLLFAGMFFKLEGATDVISNVILCRWCVEGLGTSVNLNDLTHMVQEINPLIEIEPEKYFEFTVEHMNEVIIVISAMTLILMVASYFVLRKNVNKNM